MAESDVFQTRLETKISEMGFWIDSYDDIFSDFDPRPFAKRQMSDDFIGEVRKRYKETPKGEFEVSFYLPKGIRDAKTENIIRKRLREYFAMEIKGVNEKIRKRRQIGIMYFAAGVAILAAEVIIVGQFRQTNLTDFAGILLVPAGWFSIWNSFELILQTTYEYSSQMELFQKMGKCNYIFGDLEDAKKMLEEPAIAPPQKT